MINFPDNPPQDVRQGPGGASRGPRRGYPSQDARPKCPDWYMEHPRVRGCDPALGDGPDDSPKRGLSHVLYIAEIISRLDVVALQEVKGDLGALRLLMQTLGPEWAGS
jgi:hypothetical protein